VVEFAGNIDEPLAHPGLYDFLCRLHQIRPDLKISIHTNGGLGQPDDFARLSRLLASFRPTSHFRFSIDGLEDTNHIYRQGVKFSRVMANMRAAIDGGARVCWQYIVFPWNKHQVDETRALAQTLGCHEFWLRPDRSEATSLGLEEIRRLKEQNAPNLDRPRGKMPSSGFGGSKIACSYHKRNLIFISWEGKVWPCCFISNIFYESQSSIDYFQNEVLARYPENFNNLHFHDFDTILSSPYFKNDLMESWTPSGDNDAMKWRCAKRCDVTRLRSSDHRPDDRGLYELTKLSRF
jgi:MoaA/NifB/PqqE/SkfB family radical SAM enzyme